MSESENRNTILKLSEIISSGQADRMADLLCEDLVWQTMRKKNPTVLNKAGIIAALKKEAALMKEGRYRFWIKSMTVEDNRVAAEAEGHGTLPDGSYYQQIYHMLFVLRDGKVAEAREYYDAVHCDEAIRRFW